MMLGRFAVACAALGCLLAGAGCGGQPRTRQLETASPPAASVGVPALVHTATAPATAVSSPQTPEPVARPCLGSDFSLSVGKDLPAPTGRAPIALVLTNISDSACAIIGYPLVSLYDATGMELPFEYSHRGGQVVTSRPPALVIVPPNGAAHVAIEKYRCDTGDLALADTMRLLVPGSDVPLLLAMQHYPGRGYCGPGDPGSTIAVSPVASSSADTTRFGEG